MSYALPDIEYKTHRVEKLKLLHSFYYPIFLDILNLDSFLLIFISYFSQDFF